MLDYAAFPEQRQALIRELLQQEGRVVCAALSARLKVSEHTVRRDLKELAAEGVCKRVHGGAVSIMTDGGELTRRASEPSGEKLALAQAAARLIKPGACLFIDAGSTNLELAKVLPAGLALTVVTNSPLVAAAALAQPECEVIMLGGVIQRKTGGSLGITAQSQLQGIHFDQTFLGACALDPEQGVTAFDFQDAEFKRAVIAQSSEVIVALTAHKFPGVARFAVAGCEEISTLLVDRAAMGNKLALLEDKEVSILFA